MAVADDHPVVRAGLRALLESDSTLEVVGEFDNLPSTRAGVRTTKPAILLLDLAMAGISTLQSIPDLISSGGGVRIIVLTMHDDPGFAREAFRLGAQGYVLKDAAADELLLAVRSVQRGSTYLHPSLGARLATLNERPGGLTEREVEVLRLITAGHTNAEIGQRLFVSLRTVESHRGQIRSKLNLDTRAELSSWALEHGITTIGSPNQR